MATKSDDSVDKNRRNSDRTNDMIWIVAGLSDTLDQDFANECCGVNCIRPSPAMTLQYIALGKLRVVLLLVGSAEIFDLLLT